jgi:hypothetical protein
MNDRKIASRLRILSSVFLLLVVASLFVKDALGWWMLAVGGFVSVGAAAVEMIFRRRIYKKERAKIDEAQKEFNQLEESYKSQQKEK